MSLVSVVIFTKNLSDGFGLHPAFKFSKNCFSLVDCFSVRTKTKMFLNIFRMDKALV